MSKPESFKRFLRRWLTSLPFYVLLGLILGVVVAIPAVPRPKIATINISGPILDQSLSDDILDSLKQVRDNNSIKAVVLQIDSPGGGAALVEPIYLELLRLRQEKPVVAVIASMGASGGYYIAIAANFIYAQPTSQVGSIGVWGSLPDPEELEENVLTSGLFKATAGSRRQAIAELEMVRQEFVTAVMSQRGDRLKLSAEEISLAALYLGVQALKYGLVDDIGSVTTAIEKAASLARLRDYEVVKLANFQPLPLFFFFSVEQLKSRTGSVPVYYYLYFESK